MEFTNLLFFHLLISFESKNYSDNNIQDGRTCYQGQEVFIFHLIHSTLFLLEEYHFPDSSSVRF